MNDSIRSPDAPLQARRASGRGDPDLRAEWRSHMTTNSIRAAFEQMDDGLLLATAAFFADEYTPNALRVLKAVAESRGISEASIRDHRESCYPEIEFEFRCETCNRELLLERAGFVDGEYTCPHCNSCNPVHYIELVPPPPSLESFTKFMLQGGIIGEIRDAQEYQARRASILDGTYWSRLKGMGKSFPQGGR